MILTKSRAARRTVGRGTFSIPCVVLQASRWLPRVHLGTSAAQAILASQYVMGPSSFCLPSIHSSLFFGNQTVLWGPHSPVCSFGETTLSSPGYVMVTWPKPGQSAVLSWKSESSVGSVWQRWRLLIPSIRGALRRLSLERPVLLFQLFQIFPLNSLIPLLILSIHFCRLQ